MAAFWHIVHNAVAHPLLLVLPERLGTWLHDETARRAWPEVTTAALYATIALAKWLREVAMRAEVAPSTAHASRSTTSRIGCGGRPRTRTNRRYPVAEWRIEPTDTKRHVRLTLGGTEFCLTVDEAMALVAGAPRMAGGWETHDASDPSVGVARAATDGSPLAIVYGRLNGTEDERLWQLWSGTTCIGHGRADSLAEALRAADSALMAAGYVLGGGGGG